MFGLRLLTCPTMVTAASRGLDPVSNRVRVEMTTNRSIRRALLRIDQVGNLQVQRQIRLIVLGIACVLW